MGIAATLIVATFLLIVPSARASGISLTKANWASACSGEHQNSGSRYDVQTGATNSAYIGPQDSTGIAGSHQSAVSLGAGYPDDVSSHIKFAQWFDLGPSSGSGCFTPSSSSITVTYTWQFSGGLDAIGTCDGSGNSYSASDSVNIYANVHSSSGYMAGTSGNTRPLSVSLSQTCGALPPHGNGWVTSDTTTTTQWTVSVSGTVSTSGTYDFYTSLYVEPQTSATDSGGNNGIAVGNITATLLSISCPSC